MGFLRNSWYCAGWADDLGQPVARKLLGEPVLLYRTEGGEAVAMSNRCPHRFAPLHQGKVIGESIQCPYHGLRFGTDGMCNHNPHGDGQIPKAARVKTYPLVEKKGVLWIWLGDAALADASTIVDGGYDFVTDRERFATAKGYLRVEANYQLVTDNLLDLTHAPYLHEKTVGGKPEDSVGNAMQYEFQQDGLSIRSNYSVGNMPPTPQMQPLWHEPVGDFWAFMSWHPACTLTLDLGMTRPGRPKTEGMLVPSAHFLVPESDTVTHYFFAIGRNVEIHDEEQTRLMAQFVNTAFSAEDEPMIRACQAQMGTTDLWSLKPVLLQTDVASVRARRLLDELIAKEATGSAARAAVA